MRSLKYLYIKPCHLYGRKFRVCLELLNPFDFNITYIIDSIVLDGEDRCLVEWFDGCEKRCIDYSWGLVIKNIREGTWILL